MMSICQSLPGRGKGWQGQVAYFRGGGADRQHPVPLWRNAGGRGDSGGRRNGE